MEEKGVEIAEKIVNNGFNGNVTKPKKKLWLVVGLIIVILAAMGGVWYYLEAKDKSKEEAKTKDTATTADETADWKTYTNSTYGFSFKYPAQYKVNNDPSDSDSDITISTDDDYWLYGVIVSKNTNNQTLDQVAEQKFDTLVSSVLDCARDLEIANTPSFSRTDITVGGAAAKKMIAENIACSPRAEVVILKGENIITISPRAADTEFDQILSTFQFTK